MPCRSAQRCAGARCQTSLCDEAHLFSRVTFSYFAYFLNSGSSAMLLHPSAALRFAIPLHRPSHCDSCMSLALHRSRTARVRTSCMYYGLL